MIAISIFDKKDGIFERIPSFLHLCAIQNNLHHPTHAKKITLTGKLSFNQSNDITATVKLWEANTLVPIGECIVTAAAKGHFTLNATPGSAEAVLFITAELHHLEVVLLSVLSPNLLEDTTRHGLVANELTTVASAFTCAQFFEGLHLSGNLRGLTIAAKNTPNLVNPLTGSWGDVLTNPFNITQNETLARLNNLGALITAYGTVNTAENHWQHAFLPRMAFPFQPCDPRRTCPSVLSQKRFYKLGYICA